MSDSSKNENSDLDDLLAAYNIAVTEEQGGIGATLGVDGENGGDIKDDGGGEKTTDNFLEPPAAKKSKRKNYVPHKPRHFLGEEGEDSEGRGASAERRSLSPSERTSTPTSSRGSSRGTTPTPSSSGVVPEASSDLLHVSASASGSGGAVSKSLAVSPSSSGGFNVSELRRHLQHQSRLQPYSSPSSSVSSTMTTITRPTIEPSEIYVAPNQPSSSNARSMAPSQAMRLLQQQRKMANTAKMAQQQQQQRQQQPQQQGQKRTAPIGSTIVSAPIMLIPVSGTPIHASSAGTLGRSPTTATQVHQSLANNQIQQQLLQQQQQQQSNFSARSTQSTSGGRNSNVPRMSIVENPNYIPPRKVSASGVLPQRATASVAAATPTGISGAMLPSGLVGIQPGSMIGVVSPSGVATAASVPQSVRSDKFIASQVVKNQVTLQKQAGVPDPSAVNVASIVNFVSHSGGAMIAVPSGGLVTPLMTTSTLAPTVVASSSLLPPQKNAAVQQQQHQPASGVNLPSVQALNSLPRDVVKNILTKKYVTPYKPKEMPPAAVMNKMASSPGGAGPHSCADCGDVFWMRSSYDNHRARRSMKLSLNCKWCGCKLTFYNKCVMLEHAREHSMKDQSLDLAKVVISPIPRELVSSGASPMDVDEPSSTREKEDDENVENPNNNNAGKDDSAAPTASYASGNPTLLVPTNLLINQPIAFAPVIDGVPGKDGQPTALIGGNGIPGGTTAKALIPVQANNFEMPVSFLPANVPAPMSVSSSMASSTSFVVTPSSASSVTGAVAASLPKGGLLKCPECAIGAQSITALQVHFGEREKALNRAYQCYCGFFTPSPCALAAHKRIHTETRPFVCPECGALFNDKATFSAHLQLMCLHYSRCPGYQCPKCGDAVVYNQLELVRSHVVTAHGETYYKCQACPMAFKSMTSFDAHRAANHGGAIVAYKTIYKCPLCDTVFHQLQQQQQHMDTHMKDVAKCAKYAYRCAECKRFYETKSALQDHVKTTHFKDMATRICNVCFQPFASDADWQRHLGSDGKCKRWKAATDAGKNGMVDGVKTSSLENNDLSKSDQPMTVDDDDDDDDDDVQEIADITADSKTDDSSTSFPPTASLDASGEPRDMEEDIPEGVVRVIPVPPKNDVGDGNKPPSSSGGKSNFAEVSNWLFQESYKLMCKVCFERYNSITELTAHGRRHVQDGLNVCTHRYCQNLQFASRDALQAHVRSGHRTDLPEARPIIDIDHVPWQDGGNDNKTNNNSTNDEDDEPMTNGKKAKTEAAFSCAKCDFSADDQAVFMTHIVGHKTDKDSIQCADCGMCFAAEPSLRRHLIVTHKIREFSAYLTRVAEVSRSLDRKNARNRAEEASRRSSPASVASSDGGPKECNVCYKPFESDAALKTHMRTHGMAFIRSKRFSIDS